VTTSAGPNHRESILEAAVRATLLRIVSDRLDIPSESLTDSTSFVEDLEADSLDLADLALTIEEEFSLRIPQEDIPQMLTLGAAEVYLERRLSEQHGR